MRRLVLFVVLAIACMPPAPPFEPCTGGTTQACPCEQTDGSTAPGQQLCGPEGTWRVCRCLGAFLHWGDQPIDFGPIEAGDEAVLVRSVSNGSGAYVERGTLTLSGPDARVFSVEPEQFTVQPTGAVDVRIAYRPPAGSAVAHQSTLSLRACPECSPLDIAITGRATMPDIRVEPEMLDFGAVLVGDAVDRDLVLSNPTSDPIRALVTLPAMPGFSATGVIGLDSMAVRTVPITFAPLSIGAAFEGVVRVQACGRCEPHLVTVRGMAVDRFLRPTTERLDFGAISPGQRRTMLVGIENVGPIAREVFSASVDGSSEITVDAAPTSVAPGGRIELPVTYAPSTGSALVARLEVATNDPRVPILTLDLRGYSGGPETSVMPDALDFGRTALGDARLESVRIGGSTLDAALELTDLTVESDDATFTLVEPPPDPQVPVGGRTSLQVRFAPTHPGPSSATLVITTNDDDTPVLRVPLTGTGVELPPCVLEAPSSLSFGNVPAGVEARLPIVLENAGGSDCLLRDPVFESSDPTLAFGGSFDDDVILGAGEQLEFPIHFAPLASGPATASLRFVVNGAPPRTIAIMAVSARSCVVLPPGTVDLGPRSMTCPPDTLDYLLLNACTAPLSVGDVWLARGDGPFQLASTSPVGPIGAGVRLSVAVHPVPGPAIDALLIDAGEPAGPLHVPLRARFVQQPQREDVVTSAAMRDVLLVVGDAPDMAPFQVRLASVLEAIFGEASPFGGWRAAVASANAGPTGRAGALVQAESTSPLFVTFPDVPSLLGANVIAVGTRSGDGVPGAYDAFEAVLLALRRPDFAAFRRANAGLDVVIVTSVEDRSPRSVEEYVMLFRALGGNTVRVHAIAGAPEDGAPPARLAAAAAATHGASMALGPALSALADPAPIGEALFSLDPGTYRLPVRALPASLAVLVDDAPVPSGESNRNWHWDEERSAIVFHPEVAPGPDAEVRVTSTPVCF